jgi:hypothetical protein
VTRLGIPPLSPFQGFALCFVVSRG